MNPYASSRSAGAIARSSCQPTLQLAVWHVCACSARNFRRRFQVQLGGQAQITPPGASWCVEKEVDLLCPTLADITAFLAYFFDEGLEYRAINTYRSALSGVLPPIEGFPVSQHPWLFAS